MYKLSKRYVLMFLLGALLAGVAPALRAQEAGGQSGGTATLPLGDILKLYEERMRPGEVVLPPPPLAGALSQVLLEGRLLTDAVELQAQLEVVVLASGSWTRIPLFPLDSGLTITQLPRLEEAYLVVDEGSLVLLTRRAGVYAFALTCLKQARITGLIRRVELKFEPATRMQLNVKYDEQFCRLLNRETRLTPAGVQVAPTGQLYSLSWEQLTLPAAGRPEYGAEVESMVKAAYASVVSTLEGEFLMRVLYELTFSGSRPLTFEIPPEYALLRVYINGLPQTFTPEEGRLQLTVQPARSGDQAGTVELVLSRSRGYYLLAGTLDYNLPLVSWPQLELFLALHLPDIFDYHYVNGSLSPASAASSHQEYTYLIPTPGKEYNFHQYLIKTSAPHLSLGYTIELE